MTSPDEVRSGRVVPEVSVEQVGEDSPADQGVIRATTLRIGAPYRWPSQSWCLEITTFGLVPEYVGQGIGGNALTLVLQQAWRHNGVAASGCARRVQHPNALKTTTTAASG
jgi:GNAT superfamily N-acetyltransferase